MKDQSNSFWAAIFILIASILAVTALFAPTNTTATMSVLTLASSIVTGAFGYIQGQKDGKASVTVPSQPSPSSATVVTMGDSTEQK